MRFEEVLARFPGAKRVGAEWKTLCPVHGDRDPSLSIREGDNGNTMIVCSSRKCPVDAICEAVGLKVGDLFATPLEAPAKPRVVAEYAYRDAAGKLLYQAVRFEPGKGGKKKDFRQRRPDGKGGWIWNLQGVERVPYRLPELLKLPRGSRVYVVEGEKCVDALVRAGAHATTNVGGAGNWQGGCNAGLVGQHVVVIPDNDDPGKAHAQDVVASAGQVAASIRVLELPGAGLKDDVYDWLARGGKLAELDRMADAASDLKPPSNWQEAAHRIGGEWKERQESAARMLRFGHEYLDDALTGIAHGEDLILVVAPSGVGKTGTGTKIARNVCKAGARVGYFALEAKTREIERRIKFELIARHYYSKTWHPRPLRFQDWYYGLTDEVTGQYEALADRDFAEETRGLRTFYKPGNFTGEDFLREYAEVAKDVDLVILDHLHFLDVEDENENRAQKRFVQAASAAIAKHGVPIIAMAHVRKRDKRLGQLIVDADDIHGSSDIAKISIKIVVIARAPAELAAEKGAMPTLIGIAKNRHGGDVTPYVALCNYDPRTGGYSPGYLLGMLTDGGREFTPCDPSDVPPWARRATNRQASIDPQPSPPPAHEYDGNDFDPVTGEFR